MSVKIFKNGASNIDQLTDVQIGGDFDLTNNDILQYKANSGLWINSPTIYTSGSGTAVAVTGTTETISNYVQIPANFIVDEATLRFRARVKRVGVAGNVELRLYTNTSLSLSGATQMAYYLFPSARTGTIMKRDIYCESIGVNYCVDPTSSIATDDGSGWASSTLAIDWSVSRYLIVSVKNVNGADSTTIQNTIFEAIWSQL